VNVSLADVPVREKIFRSVPFTGRNFPEALLAFHVRGKIRLRSPRPHSPS